MNYWLHRISHLAHISYPLIDVGFLSIGYSTFSTDEFIENALNGNEQVFNRYFQDSWGYLPRNRWTLWNFLSKMKKGDVVLVPSWGTFSIYRIIGEKPIAVKSVTSTLQFNLTGNLFVGSLKFQNGATLYAPNESAIFHIGNDFQWNGTVETDDMISAAQHIMVYYYGTNRVFVQTDFAGTIIAPNAEVVVGQSGKNFYGAIFAKSIVVHQNTKITWVPFVSMQMGSTVVDAGNQNLNYTVRFFRG